MLNTSSVKLDFVQHGRASTYWITWHSDVTFHWACLSNIILTCWNLLSRHYRRRSTSRIQIRSCKLGPLIGRWTSLRTLRHRRSNRVARRWWNQCNRDRLLRLRRCRHQVGCHQAAKDGSWIPIYHTITSTVIWWHRSHRYCDDIARKCDTNTKNVIKFRQSRVLRRLIMSGTVIACPTQH